MSQLPPPPDFPDPFPPDSYSYASVTPGANAGKQLRLAVIFTFVSSGLDGLGFLGLTFACVLFAVVDLGPPKADDPPHWLLSATYGTMAGLMLVFGIIKLIAAFKLKRAGPNAWGWGLTAGIIGAAQLLCANCCFVQPGFGIYTIVVLSFETVRSYLKQLQAENRSVFDATGPS